MLRISLRQLLLLIAAVALAIVSLKYASPAWQIFVGLALMVALILSLAIGLFDRGPRQAFAIANAVVMIAYLLVLIEWVGVGQKLPTTQLLLNLYPSVVELRWYYEVGGAVSPQDQDLIQVGNRGFYEVRGAILEKREVPNSDVFITIGHCWWAFVLGLLGGHFARFVYVRRMKETTAAKE